MQKVSTYYTFVCQIYDYHFFDKKLCLYLIIAYLDKDLITQENGEYFVYDLFFQLWIERK